ncbi:MAG: nuclear transport factor 2 family protein [Flavobacterium sp.]|nr:MAG: nuclear transport factor 2 family protein [Flavobacterium sp.]
MKHIYLLALICFSLNSFAQTEAEDKRAIREVLDTQRIAWSNNDLEGFMQGYWKSDSLKFYGSRGVTYGWEQTLANYKKGYPTKDHSGTLTFKLNDISKISEGSYWVMGEFFLKRNVGDANGIFMIIFRKIDGEWKIVADMSCG